MRALWLLVGLFVVPSIAEADVVRSPPECEPWQELRSYGSAHSRRARCIAKACQSASDCPDHTQCEVLKRCWVTREHTRHSRRRLEPGETRPTFTSTFPEDLCAEDGTCEDGECREAGECTEPTAAPEPTEPSSPETAQNPPTEQTPGSSTQPQPESQPQAENEDEDEDEGCSASPGASPGGPAAILLLFACVAGALVGRRR